MIRHTTSRDRTPSEFAICVGPAIDACGDSGLFGGINITDSGIVFSFFGGTEAAVGSFTVTLSGFAQTITGVTKLSGELTAGTFGVTSFTADSITFTGTAGAFGPAGTLFAAINSAPFVFDVDTAPAAVPEPAALGLLGLGILGIAAARRRKAA